MNRKLVEALAEAVMALPADEYALFLELFINDMVRKAPNVADGQACIRGANVSVWTLISLMNQGADDAKLLQIFPELTFFAPIAARSYYSNNINEIDILISVHPEVKEI